MSIDRTISLQMPTEGATNKGLHWVTISDSNVPGSYTPVMMWRGLTLPLITKWNWYFDYRAALHKVQNPKKYVRIHSGWEANVPSEKEELIRLQNRLPSAKGEITKMHNRIEKHLSWMENYRAEWKQRYPLLEPYPVEEDVEYKRAVDALNAANAKLAGKRKDLVTLEGRIAALKQFLN